jgi:hypothetical protein
MKRISGTIPTIPVFRTYREETVPDTEALIKNDTLLPIGAQQTKTNFRS